MQRRRVAASDERDDMNAIDRSMRTKLTLLAGLALAGCATAPPVPTAYEPKFRYPTTPPTSKIDVTVGIVAPQFTGDGLDYVKSNRDDAVVREMLSGMRSGFNELLVAKGFNVSGPFDSLDAMTFPEKKGADFIIYPEFDVGRGYAISAKRPRAKPTALALLATVTKTKDVEDVECDYTVQPRGTVSFVALEPLSREKMWVKRMDVEVPPETFVAYREGCEGSAMTGDIRNAWAKAHEAMFTSVMTNIDRYVSAEEFQVLKRQSQELRQKKVY
jgi:hypothetical protein